MTRPSGATLVVLKTFDNEADCEEQYRLLMSAPDDTVMRPLQRVDHGFTMPLGTGGVARGRFGELPRVLRRLWFGTPQRACSRQAYHEYVASRPTGACAMSVEYATLMSDAMRAERRLYYDVVRNIPIAQAAFVHGDATVSNFVMTGEGPRAIDLSPRLSPPEHEVDLGKLLFSALGFDVPDDAARGNLMAVMTTAMYPRTNQALLRYYLLTHAIRVMSKEPPETVARFYFYRSVMNYVQDHV